MSDLDPLQFYACVSDSSTLFKCCTTRVYHDPDLAQKMWASSHQFFTFLWWPVLQMVLPMQPMVLNAAWNTITTATAARFTDCGRMFGTNSITVNLHNMLSNLLLKSGIASPNTRVEIQTAKVPVLYVIKGVDASEKGNGMGTKMEWWPHAGLKVLVFPYVFPGRKKNEKPETATAWDGKSLFWERILNGCKSLI